MLRSAAVGAATGGLVGLVLQAGALVLPVWVPLMSNTKVRGPPGVEPSRRREGLSKSRERRSMTEKTGREGWTPEERELYDAQADHEAWSTAGEILTPWVEATRVT